MMFVILDGISSSYGTLMDMTKYLSTYVALVLGMGECRDEGTCPWDGIKTPPKFLGDGGLILYILKKLKFTINICSCL